MLLAEGDEILLPQVKEDEDHKSLSRIFGGYILGWHTEGDNPEEYHIGMTAEGNITFVADLNNSIKNYVQCKFVDSEDNEIHDSGLVADGAQSYMALSGMDANTIKNYNDGFTQWVQRYVDTDLNRTQSANGILTFNFGEKKVVVEEPIKDNKPSAMTDYILMVIILALGVAATIASLTVYIIMRKKHHQVNLKSFKEETRGHLTV